MVTRLGELISFLFVFLFVYAATNKLMDVEVFEIQLKQSPMLTSYAEWVSWAVPIGEVVIAGLLLFGRSRLAGLYASFAVMVLFTAYIVAILGFSDVVPCSCGGILEKLGWGEHLAFNIFFVVVAAVGVVVVSSQRPSVGGVRVASWLGGSMFFSVGVVVVLMAMSNAMLQAPGSFRRFFRPHVVMDAREMPLAFNSYYLAGVSGGRVYLGNSTLPRHVLSVDSMLRDTTHIGIAIAGDMNLRYYRIVVRVDSPYFYFSDGAIPFVYRGHVGEWVAHDVTVDSVYFLDVVSMGKSSLAIRALSAKRRENVLGKVVFGRRGFVMDTTLLEKQVDGVFCTDGMLHFDARLRRLVYVYYYRNEYLVADTNLVREKRGRTIDTTSRVRVQAAQLSREMHVSNRLASPPSTVNQHSCIWGRWLFVHSPVRSSNEIEEEFERGSVIDVYDWGAGRYQFSFYVRGPRREKVKGLLVSAGVLYVLYDHGLQRYVLNSGYFQEQGE